MPQIKIASWNVNSLRVRLEHVLDWLKTSDVDVLGLQELKLSDDEFPISEFEQLGYESAFTGQKTYNGVALLSKYPLTNICKGMPSYDDEQQRVIAADVRGVRVVNVYVPNGQELGSEKFAYKQNWFRHLQATMIETLRTRDKVVLMGDFNITPSDTDVHDPAKWRGKIHCSNTERLMLQKLMSCGLYDSFRHLNSQGDAFSWWDYRGGGYRANEGLRIDLILSSAAMIKALTACVIDEKPRQRERPSDHTPVIATYALDSNE